MHNCDDLCQITSLQRRNESLEVRVADRDQVGEQLKAAAHELASVRREQGALVNAKNDLNVCKTVEYLYFCRRRASNFVLDWTRPMRTIKGSEHKSTISVIR